MIDLTVVVPAHGEMALAAPLVPRLHAALAAAGCRAELLVVQAAAEATLRVPDGVPARVVVQSHPGYGAALQAGFRAAAGAWVLTIDADTADAPTIVTALWARRHGADVLVGSRYVAGGEARMPPLRAGLSRVVNAVFGRGLSLGVHDMSSGMRLYRAEAVRGVHDLPSQLDALQAILVQVYAEGWTVAEVPVHYAPVPGGQSHARAWRFAADYLRTFWRLWKLRNSIECADYDARAHDSAIPLQRYWQRSGIAMSPSSSLARGRCSTSAAGRAGSSPRCRRAASPSTCCCASCATRGDSAGRWCTPRASRCRSPTPASRACCARR